jgi:hypothetical protein
MMIGCQNIAFGPIFTPPIHVVGQLIRICFVSISMASSLDGVKVSQLGRNHPVPARQDRDQDSLLSIERGN